MQTSKGPWVAVITLLTVLVAAGPALAQGAPDRAFVLRIGGHFPAGDGIWNDNELDFTLDQSDFDGFALGFGYVSALNNDLELGFNLDFYGETVLSEYRGFLDQNDWPIFHDTRYEMVPLTADLRWLPTGRYRLRARGRQVLKPVWYLSAGVGLNFWSYEEFGDFIDFLDPGLPVYFDRYKDDGVAFETHASAGLEWPVSPTFNVTAELRYSWSDDTLENRFGHFDATREFLVDRELDMNGVWLTFGAAWRF